jgi:hypothetical protein
MRAILCLLTITACERTHELKVLLGPDPVTPSQGFLCKQTASPNDYLIEKAVAGDGTIQFNMVVDVITLGGKLPGCRGEEIVTACKAGACKLTAQSARYCVPIKFPTSLASDANRAQLMQSITQQLETQAIATNAPDGPVLIRAVATTQACDAVTTPQDGVYPSLDGSAAVGCAYSCPAILDDVDGPISLSMDTLTDQCEPTVRACAGFPGM